MVLLKHFWLVIAFLELTLAAATYLPLGPSCKREDMAVRKEW